MMKLNGVMLGSDNPKALGEFYTKIFGEPGWQQDDWYGFDVGGGTLMISGHSEVKGKNVSPGRIMLAIEAADLLAEAKRITDLGAEVIAEPYQANKEADPNGWLATFADPDGNYFQLMTPWKE